LSVSTLVALAADPDSGCARLRRRLPTKPDPHALLGTAFHDWVQRFFHAERLFDLDDLPGAVDRDAGDAEELAELQAAFAVSPWAARTPIDVEVPFDMVIGGRVVRGRIDASSPTMMAAPRWWTGRPANRPTRQKPSSTRRFSSRSTGWRGHT
jgi:DNA helicase-2/ATP-dependent DNA helicase PcrA